MLLSFEIIPHIRRVIGISSVGILLGVGSILGQAPAPSVGPVVGISIGPGLLDRAKYGTPLGDTTPPFGVTNIATSLGGWGVTVWGGVRLARRLDLLVDYLRWWDGDGNHVSGLLVGPALRLGAAEAVEMRVAVGSVRVPMETWSVSTPWQDVERLERTRESTLAVQLGVQYERRFRGGVAITLGGRWLVSRPSTPLGARLWYHHQVLQAGIQWMPWGPQSPR